MQQSMRHILNVPSEQVRHAMMMSAPSALAVLPSLLQQQHQLHQHQHPHQQQEIGLLMQVRCTDSHQSCVLSHTHLACSQLCRQRVLQAHVYVVVLIITFALSKLPRLIHLRVPLLSFFVFLINDLVRGKLGFLGTALAVRVHIPPSADDCEQRTLRHVSCREAG